MNERDSLRIKRDPPRGILRARPSAAGWGHARFWPSADLAPFVEHYWIVRWDVEAPEIAETLPHPSVHLVLRDGDRTSAEVVGVMRGRFTTTLAGRGRVVGTKFRPGAFRPFVEGPVASLTDRRWPAASVLGPRADGLAERALARDGDREAIAAVEAVLREARPVADEAMALAGRVVARIVEDRTIVRIEPLVEAFGLSVRSLQRLFRQSVGVGPKWVIQRYRLIEAAERLASGEAVDGAELALELGYADQAHFVRDFKRVVGHPPAAYRKAARGR